MNEIALMIIDKPYYDYDYEYVKDKKQNYDRTIWSDDKVAALLNPAARKYMNGKGRKKNKNDDLAKAETLQREAMKAIADAKARCKDN